MWDVAPSQGRLQVAAGRYGAFASLPIPDVEESLREVERALDTLDLDGVVLLTNYDSTYLGDTSLGPIS